MALPAYAGNFAFAQQTTELGASDGNDAPTGFLGEHLTSTSTGIVFSTGTTASMATLSLSAGDWEVRGDILFQPTSTTTIAVLGYGFNTTQATFPSLPGKASQVLALSWTTGANQVLNAGPARFSLATPANVYAVAQANFGVAAMTASVAIAARRVR